jgi:hypothetical protein
LVTTSKTKVTLPAPGFPDFGPGMGGIAMSFPIP